MSLESNPYRVHETHPNLEGDNVARQHDIDGEARIQRAFAKAEHEARLRAAQTGGHPGLVFEVTEPLEASVDPVALTTYIGSEGLKVVEFLEVPKELQ